MSWLPVWIVAVLLLAAWSVWLTRGRVTVYEVSLHARVEVARAPHPVAAAVSGRVVSRPLTVGSFVEADDVLLQVDDTAARLRLAEEEARVASLPVRMASVRREIEARQDEQRTDRQAALRTAEVARLRGSEAAVAADDAGDYERRMRQLGQQGLVAVLDLRKAAGEAARATAVRDALTADVGRVELDARARSRQYDAVVEGLRTTVAGLDADLVASRAAVARLREAVAAHVVRAPVSGRVGEVVALQPGTYVAAGQRVVTILPDGALRVVAAFAPSPALGRVRVGADARLRLDGFPWAQYGAVPATVTRVAGEVGDGGVRVELVIAGAAASVIPLQHGLPGTVEVHVEEVSPAVLLLRAAGLWLASSPEPDAHLATGP